jgi:Kef-type K+ transport system membrane component KefB
MERSGRAALGILLLAYATPAHASDFTELAYLLLGVFLFTIACGLLLIWLVTKLIDDPATRTRVRWIANTALLGGAALFAMMASSGYA